MLLSSVPTLIQVRLTTEECVAGKKTRVFLTDDNVLHLWQNLGAERKVRRTKAFYGCPMLRKHKLQKQFRDEISHQGVLDIEDLVQLGRNIGTCPYYGSRSMITSADLVVLPYQSLLSKASREGLGLNLKDSIVIIDEAHNLADSLISMYDAKITLSQVFWFCHWYFRNSVQSW